MRFQSKYWTYAIISLVTLLLWVWAAAETREEKSPTFRLALAPSDPLNMVLTPDEVSVTLELEGSRLALQRAAALRRPLLLTTGKELPDSLGSHTVNVLDILDKHEALRETRVTVVSAQPAEIDLEIDALVSLMVPIQPDLPRLQTDADVVIDPPEAKVRLPKRLLERLGSDLTLEAHVDQSLLAGLEPGRSHTLEARLRASGRLAGRESVSIIPSTVTITFTVRSFIEETTLAMVRVQIGGPPEDYDEYLVAIDEADRILRDVTISAEAELIRRIQSNDGTVVVAMVHLSSRDKERRIESKPVTYFVALLPDGQGTIVEASIAGSSELPLIHLSIAERTAE